MILMLLLILPGCAQKAATSGATEPPTDSGTAAAAPESAAAANVTFSWQGVELSLDEITDEVELQPGFKAPAGKYVLAVLSIQNGRLDFATFQDAYKQACALACGSDSYAPASLEAKGVEIDGDKAYAVGTLNFYFDLPTETDISGAVFTITE
jgi:hypothetical protein